MPGCRHGHVYPEPDGQKARCGGPGVCRLCAADLATKIAAMPGTMTWCESLDQLQPYAPPAAWEATPELRWFVPRGAMDWETVLQQRWTCNGASEWRKLPTVSD
jgi:hypothetical protein